MRRSLVTAAPLVVLFIAALIANLRLAGTSPIVWVDTFNDESEVQQCLANDSCTLTGVSTSVPGQAHAVAWLELRSLLAWFGAGIDGAHLTMVVLNSLAAVLVFALAAQLGGPLAGALATWIFLHRIDALLRTTALHNMSILPFFGAVFVLACVAIVARPGFVSVTLAALVAAVMANIHLACVLTGASVVWVALTAPRWRMLLAAYGAILFALATFAVAPPTWMHNLTSLLQRNGPRGHAVVVTGPNEAMVAWTAFAVGAWVVSYVMRAPAWNAYRRRAHGAIAVIVPFVAAFLIAPRFGLHPEAKYLLHVKAASAIAAALPIGLAVRAIVRALSMQPLLSLVESVVPWALAFVVALPGPRGVTAGALRADDERMPTMRDVTAVARILRDEHGWDVARMIERLKTPHGLPVLDGLKRAAEAGRPRDAVAPDGTSSAVLMVVDTADLPDTLPSSWTVVRRSASAATVLALLQSRVDWSALMICMQASDGSPQRCERSGWRLDDEVATSVPHMPPGGKWRGTLQLWLPLRPADFAGALFMPRRLFVCGGRIVGADGRIDVDADQRHARIPAAAPGEDPALIKLEWNVGSPECDVLAYDGLPPFFVEGEVASARVVEEILRKREGS